MKNSVQVAEGFERKDRKRAYHLRDLAYKEGASAILGIIEGMLAVPDLDESEIIQGITAWVKEMQYEAGQPDASEA